MRGDLTGAPVSSKFHLRVSISRKADILMNDIGVILIVVIMLCRWLGSRVVSVLDSGTVGHGFKS